MSRSAISCKNVSREGSCVISSMKLVATACDAGTLRTTGVLYGALGYYADGELTAFNFWRVPVYAAATTSSEVYLSTPLQAW
jgi:hypothetical protein